MNHVNKEFPRWIHCFQSFPKTLRRSQTMS